MSSSERLFKKKTLHPKIIHCYEAPRSMLSKYFDKKQVLKSTFGEIWCIQIKFYPKPYVELKYGACILKNEVSAHRLGLVVQLSWRVAPPFSQTPCHGWANIKKLAQTNIWIYSKKCNMLEQIFEYSIIFILSLALTVWEFKDSNQKDDRLHHSISNGSVCKTALATPNKDLLFSQRVQC